MAPFIPFGGGSPRKRAISDAARRNFDSQAYLNPANYVPAGGGYYNSPRMVPIPMSPHGQPGYLPGHPYPQYAWPSPYGYPPEMQQAPVPVYDPRVTQVHVLLAPASQNPLQPHVLYDVRYKPEKSYITSGQSEPAKLPEEMAAQFATQPPMQKMRLVCKDLPWRITVMNSGGVTIKDILGAIHSELNQPLTEGEWWIAQEEQREKTLQAYKANCAEEAKEARRKPEEGVKRTDWLGKKTLINGISKTPFDEAFIKSRVMDEKAQTETWVLEMDEFQD